MRFVIVATLNRGVLPVPELLNEAEEAERARVVYDAIDERDPKLTQEQWWMEEGRRYGYIKRKGERMA